MSTQDDRILIHRLAAGELDALEAERARALIERDPELALLLEQLNDLQSRVRTAFPEPPPLGERPAFIEAMRRLSGTGADPYRALDVDLSVRVGRAPRVATSSAPRSSMSRLRSRASVDLTSFGGDEPSPGAHLFHLREIRREEGLPVELEFYAGDVLALHHEVLLVSAFSGFYQPTPGSIFGSIAERYGISFAAGPPPGATRYAEGLLHFSGVACPAFDSLWVVEMRAPTGQPFSVEELRTTLRSVGGRLPQMLVEATSITLPLLGTGDQGLNPRDVARELLSILPEWARSQRLRTIRVFTLELEHVAALNRALDDRDFSVGDSALFMACDQLRRQLDRQNWSEPVRLALKDLLEIASAADPSLRSIALEGRRIAETVLRVLSREADVQGRLLERGTDTLRSESANLATPHLQLLLAHGRSAAAGETVSSNDAVMILYAAMRAAELTGTPNRSA